MLITKKKRPLHSRDRAVLRTENTGFRDNFLIIFSPSYKALYHHLRFNIVQAGAAVEVEEREELVQLDTGKNDKLII